MCSLDSYDTLLCFKTNVAGYDYWWILDARSSSVRVKLVAVYSGVSYGQRAAPAMIGFEMEELANEAGATAPNRSLAKI